MRRTWISVAAVAALATVSGTALAFAQDNQEKPAAANHRAASDKAQQMGQGERMGQTAQAQTGEPSKEQKAREPGAAMKPGMKGEGAQAEKPKADEKAGAQAQSQTPNRAEEQKGSEQKGAQTEERKGQREKGAQTEERKGQPEKGAQTEERKGQPERGAQTEERRGQPEKGAKAEEHNGSPEKGAQQTGEMKNGEGQKTGENEKQNGAMGGANGGRNVQAKGDAHLSHDQAGRIAQSLMATARPQNINVNVNVGADLPGDVDLLPLPPTVVEVVPEFRGYDYVVVNDEIVIVQPSTRRVVEVINEGGGEGTQAMATTRVNPCGP